MRRSYGATSDAPETGTTIFQTVETCKLLIHSLIGLDIWTVELASSMAELQGAGLTWIRWRDVSIKEQGHGLVNTVCNKLHV